MIRPFPSSALRIAAVPAAIRKSSMHAATLAVLALLAACRTAPAPEGIATARASVKVEGAADQPDGGGTEAGLFNQISSQDSKYEGFGAGKYPSGASGTVQSQFYARAEARRAALRDLAKNILKAGADGKSPVKAYFGDSPDRMKQLEQTLESRAQVEFRTREGIEVARARIRGRELLGGPAAERTPADSGSSRGATPRDLPARRKHALSLATQVVRGFLLEDLKAYAPGSGFLGTSARPSAKFTEALRKDLDTIEPSSVEFTDEGDCIVEMQYDRGRLADLKY